MTTRRTQLQPDAEGVPRVDLGLWPTPLQHAPRLGEALGVPDLWVKRDDCCGLGHAGTKARALEYLLAEALHEGVDTVLTHGGPQSNHTALTAAAAARLGLQSVLFVTGPEPSAEGDKQLSRLLGADIVYVPDTSPHQLQLLIHRRAEAARAAGSRTLVIPLGGATPSSCVGYVRAAEELAHQLGERHLKPHAIVVAVGSAGTLAGLMVGVRRHLPGVLVWGVSAGPPAQMARRRCVRLAAETAARVGNDWAPQPEDVLVSDEWVGPGYGVPSPQAWEVVEMAARTEGLLLDPIYTGKALAGLRGLVRAGALPSDATVVFWHTGGVPALFATQRMDARP